VPWRGPEAGDPPGFIRSNLISEENPVSVHDKQSINFKKNTLIYKKILLTMHLKEKIQRIEQLIIIREKRVEFRTLKPGQHLLS
jgi:hypothetical protein